MLTERNILSIIIRFTGELPYPQVSVTPDSQHRMNLAKHGMAAPSTCSVVLVAEHMLPGLQAVMDKVDTLGQDMQKIPYAVIILGDRTVPFTTRHAMSPPIVSTDIISQSCNLMFE